MPTQPRAIGISRVSHIGDRGDTIVSIADQEKRIRGECERRGFRLLEITGEPDVSGRTPLARRHGLRKAVEAVEAGHAEAIVVSYFDRLARSVKVTAEVLSRVEAAGGEVVAADVGTVTNGNAIGNFSTTVYMAAAELVAASGGERARAGHVKAVREGRAPFPNIPFWLRRSGEDGKGPLEHDPVFAPIALEAVQMRAKGATIMEVRAFLAERGVRLSFHGVSAFLSSRFLLGELHFGELVNLQAFPALIDAATWKRAQNQHVPRGRRPKSDRLLARQGILRCGTCGARMVIGTTRQQGKPYTFYRCDPLHDCPRRVTISAAIAEQFIEDEVRHLLTGMRGKASAKSGAGEAARKLERAQAELDSATRVLLGSGIEGEEAAKERLSELLQARDEAQERLEELQDIDAAAAVVDADADWSLLTLEERRALIRAVVARALVKPGRGPDRISIQARS